MRITGDIKEIRDIVSGWKRDGDKVGFVPTMGYLHEGHLSLCEIAKTRAKRLVVSIFVNPTQFDRKDDLDNYPKDLMRDFDLCKRVGADLIFTPSNETMYPKNYATFVNVEGMTDRLCGATRPGHFRGVTTVVSKLFNVVAPDLAVFGEKDYQQLKVIERMTIDLNMPIEIIAGLTTRESDGLAMSSRNARLSPEDRVTRALCLRKALLDAKKAADDGERDCAKLKEIVEKVLLAHNPDKIDYVEIFHPETLAPITTIGEDGARMALAVFVGAVRLIDNIQLK